MSGAVTGPGARLWLLTGLVLAALAILLALGTWQLRRLAWKEDLIARLEAQARAAPTPLESFVGADGRSLLAGELSKAAVTGRWRHAGELHLYASRGGRPGWDILTPLEITAGPLAGRAVLVNRGFVPLELKRADLRAAGQEAGEVTVIGLVRPPGGRATFDADNAPARNEWFWRDLSAMAQAAGLAERALDLTLDLVEPAATGGWPQPHEGRARLANRHLEYALTWFGLAATLVGVYAFYVASVRRTVRGATNGALPGK
ncbi:MAG: SURF1 family protein [Rhizobiales bacterium]|nr:SURF1 family protein [Hyphomicrobiales bacterium]